MNNILNNQEDIDIKQLKNSLKEIITFNKQYDAFIFYKYLEKQLNNGEYQFEENDLLKYQSMIIKAKFIALYRLKEEEVIELVDKEFNYIVNINHYDILNKIDYFFMSNFDLFSDRNEFKKKLRDNLSKSHTEISSKKIFINNKETSPSISNWLRDFRNSYLENGFLDILKVSEYIANNQNMKDLSKKEKQKVKTLIKLYAHLKLDSNYEGMEESFIFKNEDGELERLEKGIFVKVEDNIIKEAYDLYERVTGNPLEMKIASQPTIPSSSQKIFEPQKNIKLEETKEEKKTVEKLLESYKAFEIDLKSINSLIKDLDKYKNNPDGLFEKFNQDLKTGNRDNLLSILVFVCQNKLLDKFLKENIELLEEFKKYLSFKLSDDVIKSIMNKSTSPETVSLYLQFLLFKKVKLSLKNAGLFGMHLANIFKKIGQDKYFPIVYGDINLEQFVWREVIEDNGLVKFK